MKKLKARLDAFSDAVIAIILTIMVLDLTPVLKDNISDYLTLAKKLVFILSVLRSLLIIGINTQLYLMKLTI